MKPPADLLAQLPDEVREAFVGLYPDTAGPLPELRARVDHHLRETNRAAKRNEFVDTTLSHTVADGLDELLSDWDTMTAIQRAIVHAAVAYYVLSEDAEDDLDSVLGFEDDAQVFNACVRFLARPELQIALE